MRFVRVPLRNIQSKKKWALNGGPFGSKLVQRDYAESGVPVIRGCNLSGDFRFNPQGFVFVTPDKAEELLANNAHAGDLLFTQRGTLGQVGIIPDALPFDRYVISQSQMKLTVDRSKADPRYIYYVFKAPETVQRILNQAFSSGVPHINLEILRAFEIDLPSLPAQERTASILSAYDDLIENNTRRIKILEEMAQMIYREWFVNFRFPGYENAKMVESELGPIPEGWSATSLGDLASIIMGQSPPSESYNSTGIGLPFHQGVTDFGRRFPTDRTYCTIENRLAAPQDILMSVRAPVGRLNIATKRIVIGRGVCAIKSKLDSQAILFQQLKEHFREEDSMGSGTIFKSVTKQDVHGIKLVKAEKTVAAQLESFLKPLFRQLELLSLKNTNLRTTRDLLLPKLISGDIPVVDQPQKGS